MVRLTCSDRHAGGAGGCDSDDIEGGGAPAAVVDCCCCTSSAPVLTLSTSPAALLQVHIHDGRVLVAEAARGMTTRFDPATYGAFARDPACAGVQIDAAAPAQPPQRKYGPRS